MKQFHAITIALAACCFVCASAHAITYNWVTDPFRPDPLGPPVTPWSDISASFTLPDDAVADGVIDASELSAFSISNVDGSATTATGSFLLNPDFTIASGTFETVILSLADSTLGYGAHLFVDRIELDPPANAPLTPGHWEFDSAPVVPPTSGVPDATSTFGALAASMLVVFGVSRKSRLAGKLVPGN